MKNERQCIICQKTFLLLKGEKGKLQIRKTCSHECHNKVRSITMSNTNKRYASDRMRKRNPMKSAQARKKVSDTLKNIKHRPPLQGGNGRGLTQSQSLLLYALGDGWFPEFIVKTKSVKHNFIERLPYHYKIDIANPSLKIAIEIDGRSHGLIKRKRQDDRKDKALKMMGWSVFRFTNHDVISDTIGCVASIASYAKRTEYSNERSPVDDNQTRISVKYQLLGFY